MNQSIFREYDVRGIYPQELNEENASRIAMATTHFLKANVLVVGGDARVSTPSLKKAAIESIMGSGCNVIDIGQCTTPLFYFSVNRLGADGGIMVTASHNPPQYNGLKIVGSGVIPIAVISGLFQIRDIVTEIPEHSPNKGSIQTSSFLNEYLDFLTNNSRIKDKSIKFVVDTSNGVAPLVLKPLFDKLDLGPILINFGIDGNFPSHSPDISKKENLEQLKNKILEVGADVGFAFDGDADRLTVLDEKGDKLPADFVVGLLFKAGSGLFKKPKVAYDLRFSRSIKELIGKNGFPSPTGYPFVRNKMEEIGADLGGELAGHFDFKEMNYADSAILAMLKILNIAASSGKTVSALVEPFKKYFNSGEVNIPIDQDDDLKSEIIENLKNKYSDGKQNFLDGIMIEYPDWWFNVRFSNTEPVVRVVVEAETNELMESKKEELISEIKKAPR